MDVTRHGASVTSITTHISEQARSNAETSVYDCRTIIHDNLRTIVICKPAVYLFYRRLNGKLIILQFIQT